MSGQQPPYGRPPQGQGPPPYGRPPQQPPYRQPPQGPPQQPPYGQPPQGPPPGAGWQQPPQPGRPSGRSRSATVLIAALAVLVLLLAASTAYLWFADDSGGASGLDTSTAEVTLPMDIGDYHAQAESDPSYEVDLDQTRDDYRETIGAAIDIQTYGTGDSSDDDAPPTITVRAVRAGLPLTPGYSTKTSSTKIVRDDVVCTLAYYEGYDPDADADTESDHDKGQKPQSCTRSDDGVTVYVNTYATSVDEGTPSLDELVDFTDEAYDAVK